MSRIERRGLQDFWRDKSKLLLADEAIRSGLATLLPRFEDSPLQERASRNFDIMLDDASETLELVKDQCVTGKRMLEIGGGIGLLSAWLLSRGFDVIAIEPGLGGHDEHYALGRRIHELLELASDRWLPLRCDEIGQIQGSFDLIYSSNVLEHISDLEAAFRAMAAKLSEGGLMRHQCPNYAIPYEPHFGLPLLPAFPRAIGALLPGVRRSELWRSLNFVSARRVRGLARDLGLRARLDRRVLATEFRRFEHDEHFRSRRPWVHKLYRTVLKPTGMIGMIGMLPPTWTTPMRVTLEWREPSVPLPGDGSGSESNPDDRASRGGGAEGRRL
jgi:SAM-dependent methyltransferase